MCTCTLDQMCVYCGLRLAASLRRKKIAARIRLQFSTDHELEQRQLALWEVQMKEGTS